MKLTEAELLQLFEVEQTCFHGNWTNETLLSELKSPTSRFCTEKRDNIIVGYALGKIAADESELYRIAVLPQYRRQGIAEKLLNELHKILIGSGAACCFLEVRSKNSPAIALYQKCGYNRIALRKNYYGDDDAVIFRKDFL